MMRTRIHGRLSTLLVAVAVTAVACSGSGGNGGGSGGGTVVQPQATVVRVTVTAPAAFVAPGESAQLVARAAYSDGSERLVTEQAAWSSSDNGVMSVTAAGVVTGGRAGRGRLTASLSDRSGSVDLLVPSVSAQPRTVRLVYLAPQDREFRDEYERGIRLAFVDLQDWYRRQLDGPVFTLHSLQVDRCRMTRTADYYLDNSYSRVLADAQRCLPVRSGDTTTTWVLYADVGHGCNLPGRLGVGSLGLTIMGQEDLQGLNDEPQINDGCQNVPKLTIGRWRGGAGHELGHAFGLPHPPGCDAGAAGCDSAALMWAGYASYPNTYLRDDEKARLRSSAFFTQQLSPLTQWDANGRP